MTLKEFMTLISPNFWIVLNKYSETVNEYIEKIMERSNDVHILGIRDMSLITVNKETLELIVIRISNDNYPYSYANIEDSKLINVYYRCSRLNVLRFKKFIDSNRKSFKNLEKERNTEILNMFSKFKKEVKNNGGHS